MSSLTAGLANEPGSVAARLVQGIGAALMAPAALSELTPASARAATATRRSVPGGDQRYGRGGRCIPGGVISQGPGWRWIFFVNPPICVAVAAGALALLPANREPGQRTAFDSQGAVLVTGGMLLLVYGLVRAPIVGWGSAADHPRPGGVRRLDDRCSCSMSSAAATRSFPSPILRVKGLVAADLTQLIAFTGFFSMFFYATLYMQEVLHYSPLEGGSRLPPDHGRVRRGGRRWPRSWSRASAPGPWWWPAA